jgi:hypothetical protein
MQGIHARLGTATHKGNTAWTPQYEGSVSEVWTYINTRDTRPTRDSYAQREGSVSEVWTCILKQRWSAVVTCTGTHWIGVWMGPRAGLDAEEKRKIPWPCLEPNSGRPTSIPSLHWLSYCGYKIMSCMFLQISVLSGIVSWSLKRFIWVISSIALSYSGGSGFEFRHEYRLS